MLETKLFIVLHRWFDCNCHVSSRTSFARDLVQQVIHITFQHKVLKQELQEGAAEIESSSPLAHRHSFWVVNQAKWYLPQMISDESLWQSLYIFHFQLRIHQCCNMSVLLRVEFDSLALVGGQGCL